MSQTLIPPTDYAAARGNNPAANLLEQASKPAFWRSAAPTGAAESPAESNSPWLAYLQKRKKPLAVPAILKAAPKSSPLGWGLAAQQLDERCQELLRLAGISVSAPETLKSKKNERLLAGAIKPWLAACEAGTPSVDFALSSLALAYLLPALANVLSGEKWWQLAEALYGVAHSAENWQSDVDVPAEETVAQQLLAGELPLTLAYLFPEIKPFHQLRRQARERLTAGFDDLLNGEGLCHGSLLPAARPLLACWTRCSAIGQQFKKNAWSSAAAAQYGWAVTQALRWTVRDGRQMFGADQPPWSSDFLTAALDLAGDAADRAAADESLGKKFYKAKKVVRNAALPEPAYECEWAGLALLRTDWTPQASIVAVDYSSDEVRLEVAAAGRRLFSGVWSFELKADGKRLKPRGSWEQSCWFSDNEVDYLELSLELENGATLERQVLLARDEHCLYLADNVKQDAAEQIEHRWRLPLAPGATFQPEAETREGTIAFDKPVARVLPLALAEWRLDPRGGELTEDKGAVALAQQQAGSALCTPLFIDLNPRRVNKPCTWRQLTVAESLEIVSKEVAVAYRVQCAKDQWAFYRSLANCANRTFLGQNISSEFFAARFLPPQGEVEELLEIDG